ncbi:MAG: hypothetical protein ACI81O_000794 [Cyclobacteriaceae bacterium]|jgi:hypothetical protein
MEKRFGLSNEMAVVAHDELEPRAAGYDTC